MNDYTPTEAEVRHIYAQRYVERVEYHEEGVHEFDRFIASVKAEALADFAQGLPLDGLRRAKKDLRDRELHWPADSVSQVLDVLESAIENGANDAR